MAKRSLFWVSLVGAMAMLMISIAPAFLTTKVAQASSHREAPLISQDPVADATDLYAFRSPDDPNTVTIVTNWIPFEEPAGGPNFNRFGDDVKYDIEIDNNGDGVEDLDYEFRFQTTTINPNTFLFNTDQITSLTDPDYNVRQSYSVARIDHGRRRVLATGLPVAPPN